MKRAPVVVFFHLVAIALLGCASSLGRSRGPAPTLVGEFMDDYNTTHALSPTEWRHGSRSTYHIVKWNSKERYFIARNDSSNPADAGLWSRVDWLELDSMAPWSWALCMSAFKAPTAESAESTRLATRSSPRTGCNGFPFTRMRSRP
jgi:hypothetical protein